MQYFGRAFDTVSRTWNSLNPSTLSGAIDVVVVQQSSGDLHCSAFHIRFGKISLLRPSQKAVDFYVNDKKVDFPMKLGEGGEAFFVFGTHADVPESLLTSPVVSPSSSPSANPNDAADNDVDFLDISNRGDEAELELEPSGADNHGNKEHEAEQLALQQDVPGDQKPTLHDDAQAHARAYKHDIEGVSVEEEDEGVSVEEEDGQQIHGEQHEEDTFEPRLRGQNPERIDKIIKRLREVKIPSSHTEDGSDVIMDMTGYKAGGTNTKELENIVTNMLDSDIDSPPGSPPQSPSTSPEAKPPQIAHIDNVPDKDNKGEEGSFNANDDEDKQNFVKTLRLSSDMLKSLNLKPGKNEMRFVVRSNQASITANIFLWKSSTPVVISDIDGTITRSDAMGHIMTFVGRDWTHAGVGRLYSDISNNGYNIMYLTSRSVGLADATRGYLKSIHQDGYTLPAGPVILSPDRTMAALRREVIMRKPEIFKMACLRDIKKLYEPDFLDETPFYAGFGNRITDGLSYRSVNVPSTKIFTINTESEVKLELLELSGIKSSYILIRDLVDQLFPPNLPEHDKLHKVSTTEFSDINFWRSPIPDLSSDEDEEDEADKTVASGATGARSEGSLDWEGGLQASFTDDDYDSEADEDYEDSGQEDEDDYEDDAVSEGLEDDKFEDSKEGPDFESPPKPPSAETVAH